MLGGPQTSTPGDEVDQDTLNSVVSTTMTSAITGGSRQLSEIELAATAIRVKTSTIRPNDRGKEVLSFIIEVEPPHKSPWRIEKLYSNVLNLDSKIRAMTSRPHLKKLSGLPDGKLFKDNAPAKVDQRKLVLEAYLQSVIVVPVKKPSEICDFFCTDIIDESRAPVAQLGYKEGYLTKRGKNFGGWKTRYFVLQGPVLEYYENVSRFVFPSLSLFIIASSVEVLTWDLLVSLALR
jgi:RalA-binding protein 1